MRIAGIVLSVIGIVGTVVFGIQAVQEIENFSFFGIDIGVSGANWTPIIISAVILVIGIGLMIYDRRASA